MTYLLLAYISVLFVAGTLMFTSLTKLTELAFVNNREYPGGPVTWYNMVGGFDSWTTMEDVAYFIAEILSDGLLVRNLSTSALHFISHERCSFIVHG